MAKFCLMFVLYAIALADGALGCSLRSMQLRHVSSDVVVLVTHYGRPIAGISVLIETASDHQTVFAGKTDINGSVAVPRLVPGEFYVTVEHAGFEASREWIKVVQPANKKAQRELAFEWGDYSFQTRRFAGTLSGLVLGDSENKVQALLHPKSVVYPGVAITVRDAFTDVEYRTTSDSAGTFVIDEIPDGVYIVEIEGGMQSITGRPGNATVWIVDIHQRAPRAFLPLELKDDGCYKTIFALAVGK